MKPQRPMYAKPPDRTRRYEIEAAKGNPLPPLRTVAQRCPTCDAPMKARNARKGLAPFLGCSRYPICKGTRPMT